MTSEEHDLGFRIIYDNVFIRHNTHKYLSSTQDKEFVPDIL